METATVQPLKLPLPHDLERFRLLYNFMAPERLGPEYLGNFEFAIDKLPWDVIKDIKENQSTMTPVEATRLLIAKGFSTRFETVAGIYDTYEDTKLWEKVKRPYLQLFEKQNSIRHTGHARDFGVHPRDFYKPFICWLIESRYEYFQIAEVLERSPGTIREWANSYGYRKFVRVVGKSPDLENKKHSRTSVRHEGDNAPARQAHADSTGVKVRNEDVREGIKARDRTRIKFNPVTDLVPNNTDALVKALTAKGYEVNLVYRPFIIEASTLVAQ